MPWTIVLAQSALAVSCAAPPAPAAPPARFVLAMPPERAVHSVAISADGQSMAYAAELSDDGRRRLIVRAIGEGSVGVEREVPNTYGARDPFFSPDGRWLAYFADGALWKVATATSSRPEKICDIDGHDPGGGTWTDDGRIVFAPLGGKGLMAVSANGGRASQFTSVSRSDGQLEYAWPHALPGGGLVFTVSIRGRDAKLEAISASGQREQFTIPAAAQAHYLSSGHLVYSYLGNLMAVRFDSARGRIVGSPVPVVKGAHSDLLPGTAGRIDRATFAVSRTGTLVWARASEAHGRSRLVRVDLSGGATTIPARAGRYQSPRISPDGRLLAVVALGGLMTRDIEILDAARPGRVMASIAGGDNQAPAWTPDGRLSFGSNRDGPQKIYLASMDGDRRVRPLFEADVAAARSPASWAPRSGRRPTQIGRPVLALYEIDETTQRNVLIYRNGSIAPVAATDANERSPVLSPDGRRVAFVSDASGRDEIYARHTDGSDEVRALTSDGGVEPAWVENGIFYRLGEKMMILAPGSDGFQAPRELFERDFERDPGANLANYDVDPSGRFLIMLKKASHPRELRIVTNWSTELEALSLKP